MDISIIIPCFNDAQTLGRAVESVRAQENVEKEIIIVDDGSDEPVVPDGDDIRLIRTDHQGVSAARNAGIEAAGGEFVTFLDADDIMNAGKSTFYHDIIEFMREKEYDIVSGDYVRQDMDSDKKTTVCSLLDGVVRLGNADNDFTAFFTPGSFCYVWNKVYRKSFLTKHDLRFDAVPFAEDRDFNARCLLCGAEIFFTDQIFCEYHYRPDTGRVSPEAILQGFMRQAQVFREMSEEQDYCRAYSYQAAYTCAFGLFFAAAGLSMQQKRQLIDKACSDEFFMEEMKVLMKYPRGPSERRGLRAGIMITACLLRWKWKSIAAWIFSFAEKRGLARKNSPTGLMNEDK